MKKVSLFIISVLFIISFLPSLLSGGIGPERIKIGTIPTFSGLYRKSSDYPIAYAFIGWHAGYVHAVAFIADGTNYALSAGSDGKIKCWRLPE